MGTCKTKTLGLIKNGSKTLKPDEKFLRPSTFQKVKLVETLKNWVAEVQTQNRVDRAVIKGRKVCNSVELT